MSVAWFGLLRSGLAFAGMLVLLSCGPRETVYVTASVLNLRTGPSTQARVVGRLLRGQELVVQTTQGDWLEVSAGETGVGWVHGNYVGDPSAVREAYQRDRARPSAGRRARKRMPGALGSGGGRAQNDAGLNLSVDQMLDGFPDDTAVEPLEPINEEARARAALATGQVAEFLGDGENLSRASIRVPVVGESDEAVGGSAELVLIFVQNAVPRWNRDAGWLAQRLRALASKDVGKMGFDADGKSVRFDYIKPLGTVRVSIYPEA